MNKKEIEERLNNMLETLSNYKRVLDYSVKLSELESLKKESESPEFWMNNERSVKVLESIKNINNEVGELIEIDEKLSLLKELIEINEIPDEIEEEFSNIESSLSKLKIKVLLNGEFDKNNAYIEIHSGAGGTESNDWTNMIFDMYKKYCDKKVFKYEIINIQPGEEVGIKGALLYVKGLYAFGLLKGETGVHRLVRISPFDSNSRRHTSFASVLVTPEIDNKVEIDIKDNDVKIDVYKSSGAGGQSVNTTDSAIRITHMPTGIVVTCQNERSQLKNKDKAFEILRGKLYLLEKQKLDEKLKDLKGNVMDVNFGSAIRSYVMCPYSLVKDTRTDAETSSVEKVLNGDLDIFVEAYLSNK